MSVRILEARPYSLTGEKVAETAEYHLLLVLSSGDDSNGGAGDSDDTEIFSLWNHCLTITGVWPLIDCDGMDGAYRR